MNQKLDLDFIPQPFFALTSINWLGLLVLLLSLLVATFTWRLYQSQQNTYLENSLILEQHKQQSVPAKLSEKAQSIAPDELKQVQESVNALTAPWNELLLAIEQANMKNIALLNLEPNYKKQQVLLAGQAKNLATVLQYIKQLEQQPMLSQVYLQKHSIDTLNPAKPVNFSVFAQWELQTE